MQTRGVFGGQASGRAAARPSGGPWLHLARPPSLHLLLVCAFVRRPFGSGYTLGLYETAIPPDSGETHEHC